MLPVYQRFIFYTSGKLPNLALSRNIGYIIVLFRTITWGEMAIGISEKAVIEWKSVKDRMVFALKERSAIFWSSVPILSRDKVKFYAELPLLNNISTEK